jgi:hypothetical protein
MAGYADATARAVIEERERTALIILRGGVLIHDWINRNRAFRAAHMRESLGFAAIEKIAMTADTYDTTDEFICQVGVFNQEMQHAAAKLRSEADHGFMLAIQRAYPGIVVFKPVAEWKNGVEINGFFYHGGDCGDARRPVARTSIDTRTTALVEVEDYRLTALRMREQQDRVRTVLRKFERQIVDEAAARASRTITKRPQSEDYLYDPRMGKDSLGFW